MNQPALCNCGVLAVGRCSYCSSPFYESHKRLVDACTTCSIAATNTVAQTWSTLVGTRSEIAVPFFEDAFVTVFNVKNKPPTVARFLFADMTRAEWANSTLTLATPTHEIDCESAHLSRGSPSSTSWSEPLPESRGRARATIRSSATLTFS